MAALLVGGVSLAQDSQGLLDLLPDDPNGFVRTVQERMAGAGQFAGPANGLLDRATIAAINSVCRDAGVLADCQLGPLSPEGAAAVVAAIEKLGGEPAPDVAVAAEAAPEAEQPPVEAPPPEPLQQAEVAEQPVPVATEIAAGDWHSSPTFGLTATVVSPGADDVQFEITGTAEGRGWINVYAGEPLPAKPGATWTFSTEASFASSKDATASLRMAATRADGSYLTELVPKGTAISADGSFVVEGTTPADTAFVRPYIQIVYADGTEADGVLQITASAVAAN